jgi:hypothetical protein
MKSSREQTCFTIEVLDADGQGTGREVDVYIDFFVDVDNAYGADADGNRGERGVEYLVEQVAIDKWQAKTLLAEEQAQVIRDAEKRFDNMDKHW